MTPSPDIRFLNPHFGYVGCNVSLFPSIEENAITAIEQPSLSSVAKVHVFLPSLVNQSAIRLVFSFLPRQFDVDPSAIKKLYDNTVMTANNYPDDSRSVKRLAPAAETIEIEFITVGGSDFVGEVFEIDFDGIVVEIYCDT